MSDADFVHCDDLIEDPEQPASLRKYLEYNRRPAIDKTLPEAQEPALFATLREDKEGSVYLGTWSKGNPDMQPVKMKAGSRIRVVMASRFGDVGITHNLKAAKGYCTRVPVAALTDFGDTP
jgi:hypothetical protein